MNRQNEGGQTLTLDQLLDQAVTDYWRNRPRFGPRCGTIYGYRDHEQAKTPSCAACRKALAMVKAIRRHRARTQVAA